MKKIKNVTRKILIVLFSIIIIMSPVFLSGCETNTPGGSQIGGGSGSIGGSSGNEEENGGGGENTNGTTSEKELGDYFSTFKMAYNLSADEKKLFFADLNKQNSELALKIMEELYRSYGTNFDAEAAKTRYIIDFKYSDGAFTKTKDDDSKKFSSIYSNGVSTLFSKQFTIEVTDGNKETHEYKYDPEAFYGDYFNHDGAIGDDRSSTETISWNFTYALNAQITEPEYYADSFLNNYVYRKKIELALLLITAGNDLCSTEGQNVYAEKAAEIDQYAKDNKIGEYKGSTPENFYLDVQTNVFDPIENNISHSGYTSSEINQIKNFILNYVIGSDLVWADESRYYNVYFSEDGLCRVLNSQFLDYSATGNVNQGLCCWTNDNGYAHYLTNETFFSTNFETFNSEGEDVSMDVVNKYITNSSGALYIYDEKQVKKDSESTSVWKQSDEQMTVNDINNSSYSMVQSFLKGGATEEDKSISSVLVDLDYGTTFDLDVNDYSQGNYVSLDNNKIFSMRRAYFKNYYNTVCKIVNSLINQEPTNEYKNEWKESNGGVDDYPFDTMYPVLPIGKVADFSASDLQLTDDGLIGMWSGYQGYQNILLVPKVKTEFLDLTMFLSHEKTAADFDLTLYLRYYDAATDSYGYWGSADDESNQFYNVGSVSVTADEDDLEFLDIDLDKILSKMQIGDNSSKIYQLDPFENPFVCDKNSPQTITKYSKVAQYYTYYSLPNGQRVVAFTENNVAKENRFSYLELLFSFDSDSTFKFSLSY